MWHILKFLIVLAGLVRTDSAQAQGTLQFIATLTGTNEVPPNTDPTVGNGAFSLDGNILNFEVLVPAETFISLRAFIQGPAGLGTNGPVIFDLGQPSFIGGSPPYYSFFSPPFGPLGAGPFTLSDSQVNDLMSGLWYVNVTSAFEPNGQLRGQIFVVPEPSGISLILFGVGIFAWGKLK